MVVSTRPILLAAGGTGGHVFPALALADTLHARGLSVMFATDSRGARYIKDRPWLQTFTIQAGTLRTNPVRLAKDLVAVGMGLLQSFDIIRSHNPAVVVGFGGYPCFPPVFAAQLLDIPTLLHEQNAVIGKANIYLAKLCTRLALSLPDFSGLSDTQRQRTLVTGNPVRPEIAALASEPYPAPIPGGDLNVLVFGGSQGAQVFARVIPTALARLEPELRARLRIRQQVQDADLAAVQQVYRDAGIAADCAPFFTDMVSAWRWAHLFIGRSGASTVAEVTAVARPAIFVPYPHHKDQQQLKNALPVARAGGAVIIEEPDFTPESLLAYVRQFMQNPATLDVMAHAAAPCGHPQASDHLADAVVSLIKPE